MLASEPLALWPLAAAVLAASVVLVVRTEERIPAALRRTPKQ